MKISDISKDNPVVAWWSGGITSAVTCRLCIDWFGADNVRVVFIDTKNEDDDTYRFMSDCEDWYGIEIERITGIGEKYNKIQDVWEEYLSLNVAWGAVCSSELKRQVRLHWEKENAFSYQAFGFDAKEYNRAKSLKLNWPKCKPIFPLIMEVLTKEKCMELVAEAGIEVPRMYKLGFQNNNCFKTGCVQGGIGYWQKMKRDFPDKFDAMAEMEHKLTDLKGVPVTMLKDQSAGGGLLFLKPHPNYPHIKDISMKKGREPKPLVECNGFCGTNDLDENKDTSVQFELNFETL